MAIFNSYFDITRGYIITLIETSPVGILDISGWAKPLKPLVRGPKRCAAALRHPRCGAQLNDS